MGYSQVKGRKPFERASKIAHTHILNSPEVQAFVSNCVLPSAPDRDNLESLQRPLPKAQRRIEHVIAVDGGMTEVSVRKEFPTASIAFMTFGPLTLSLKDLQELDESPFIGPEDMARLKNLERYSVSVPSKTVLAGGAKTFSEGVRATIHEFLANDKRAELLEALRWLLFREWLPANERPIWTVPRCPHRGCDEQKISFASGGASLAACPRCAGTIYLSDGLRLYENIDDEQGAGGIMAYLLSTLEQLVLVHIIRTLLSFKPAVLREILLIKDGPLAFFGNVAPLHKPMQELMAYVGNKDNGKPLICLVGLEKSGAFVEHAALIEPNLKSGHYLLLNNEYIYKYIVPRNSTGRPFGETTYYGAKVVYKSERGNVFVATIPTAQFKVRPTIEDLFNAAEVLQTTGELRCSMYDNALIPVVLANRLVSLADVPSSEILKRFVKSAVG
jgi:NurA domain-containing protein